MPSPPETFETALARLAQAQDWARSARKKGDALRRAGRPDTEVSAAYAVGVQALEQGLADVAAEEAALDAAPVPASAAALALAAAVAETQGALGGLCQRVDNAAASLHAYAAGAALERRFGLPSTYNRLNEIKQTLLQSPVTPLLQLLPQIEALAKQIEESLRADQRLGDSGWAWADLGDCLALLDRVDEAARAYASFVAKAEIKSPERTLDVLHQIGAQLRARHDPGAARLEAAIAALQSRLAG